MTLKGYDGEVREYPSGTWMLTSEITNPRTINEIKAGILTGHSASVIPRKEAELYKQQNIPNASLKSRTIIADIEDPVAYTVSLVHAPCQFSAKFAKTCTIKKTEDTKLSDEISQEKLEQGIIGAFKSLFNKEEEPAPTIDTSNFALKSDLEDLKSDISEIVKSEITAFKSEEDEKKKKEEEEEEKKTSNNEESSKGLTEEEEKEFQRLLAKRKPKTSNKSEEGNSLPYHIENTPTHANKSDTQTIMERLGRSADGRFIGFKEGGK